MTTKHHLCCFKIMAFAAVTGLASAQKGKTFPVNGHAAALDTGSLQLAHVAGLTISVLVE
eukprot:scaffold103823_cov19-Tisochrysis_lutea.AAC.3